MQQENEPTVRHGAALAAYARALLPGVHEERKRFDSRAELESSDGPLQAYKDAAEKAYGSPGKFDQIPFIRAFLNAARGFPRAAGERLALPVHYPRAAAAPSAEGKNYEWFVANDRTGRDTAGPALALDPLAEPTGLPIIGGG